MAKPLPENPRAEEYEGERDANGMQPLDLAENGVPGRQLYPLMSRADQHPGMHPRTLLVKFDSAARGPDRAIVWSDWPERIAKWESRGYAVVQDPYIDPVHSGKKKEILILRQAADGTVHVPHQRIGMGNSKPATPGA